MRFIELDEGLGDNIICAGIIAHLAAKDKVIIKIPDRQHNNLFTYKTFFDGLNVEFYEPGKHLPIVNPYPIVQLGREIDNTVKGIPKIKWHKLGNNVPVQINQPKPVYPLGFYPQFQLQYADRFRLCPLWYNSGEVPQLPAPKEKFAFVHDDYARGYIIKPEFVSKDIRWSAETIIQPIPGERKSVLEYREVIEAAAEIHCIDSSFFHLVNSFKPKGKLFYHMYARPNSPEFAYHTNWRRLR